MQNFTHSKKMIVFNLLFMFLLISVSFFVYFYVFYASIMQNTTVKLKMLTERSGQEMEHNLDKISRLSRFIFLDIDFQNDIKEIAINKTQENYDKIYRHFVSASILDNVVKDVAFFPRNIDGEIEWDNYLVASIYNDYLNNNKDKIKEVASLPENSGGNIFYVPIKFSSGDNSPYFALTRNVMNMGADDNFKTLGVGTMLISRLEFKNFFREIDILDGTKMRLLNKENEIIVDSSDNYQAIPATNQMVYEVPIDFLDWKISCYYDMDYLFNSTKPILFNLCLIIAITTIMVIVMSSLFNFKNTKATQYLLNTFQKIKEGQIDAKIKLTKDKEVNAVAQKFNSMMDTLNELNRKSANEQKQLLELKLENTEYELNMLYSQINKHFLFNALGGVRSLIVCKKLEQAQSCMLSLSDFLRYSLNIAKFVSVETEIKQLQAFTDIQKMRFPNISVDFIVEKEVMTKVVPKFILQPLVENAYAHGLLNQSGKIQIFAKSRKNHILFLVSDNGIGMSQEKLNDVKNSIANNEKTRSSSGNGLALVNIFRRINLINAKNGLYIRSQSNKGTIVAIKIYAEAREDNV